MNYELDLKIPIKKKSQMSKENTTNTTFKTHSTVQYIYIYIPVVEMDLMINCNFDWIEDPGCHCVKWEERQKGSNGHCN